MSAAEAPAVVATVPASVMLRRLEELEQLLRVDDELAALTATVATMVVELHRSAPGWSIAEQEEVAGRVDVILSWAVAHKDALQRTLHEQSRGRRAAAGYAR